MFRGGQSRPHGDLEIAVPAAGFAKVRDCFPEYAFDAVGSGRVWANAGAEALAATHQTWLRDPASGHFLFDVFREPHEGGTWVCRRDESLRLPYDAVIERTADGIPYLVPELVLLGARLVTAVIIGNLAAQRKAPAIAKARATYDTAAEQKPDAD